MTKHRPHSDAITASPSHNDLARCCCSETLPISAASEGASWRSRRFVMLLSTKRERLASRRLLPATARVGDGTAVGDALLSKIDEASRDWPWQRHARAVQIRLGEVLTARLATLPAHGCVSRSIPPRARGVRDPGRLSPSRCGAARLYTCRAWIDACAYHRAPERTPCHSLHSGIR